MLVPGEGPSTWRRWRSRAVWSAVGAGCSMAAQASAQPPEAGAVEVVRLEYHASPSCPDERAFVAQVQSRTPRFVLAEGTAPVRTFVVAIESDDHGVAGALTSVEPSGAQATRRVSGITCDEVLGALALITALTVDPNASTASVPPPRPVVVPPPSPPIEARPAPAKRPGWRMDAAVGATLTEGAAPGPLPAVAAFIEAEIDGKSLLSPSVRLGVERAPGSEFGVSGGLAASFDWTLGTLQACPMRWTLGAISLAPCARFGAGVLHGQGTVIAEPRDGSRLWLDAGALAHVRWAPIHALFVDLGGGIIIPLVRDRFYFDSPDVTIHQAPTVAGTAAAVMGVYFW